MATNALRSRLNKLSEAVHGPDDGGILFVIVNYPETEAEAMARVKKENPGFGKDRQVLIYIMNFSNTPISNVDAQIKRIDSEIEHEIRELKKYGLSESEIRKASKVESAPKADGKKASKNPGARIGTRRKKAG